MTLYLFNRFKTVSFKDLLTRLRGNWFIPISAVFYYLLNTGMPAFNNLPVNSYYSLMPAVILIAIICCLCDPFASFYNKTSVKVRAVALLSSIGICYCTWDILKYVYYLWDGEPLLLRLIFMILAIPFVFVLNLLFWDKLTAVLKSVLSKAKIKQYELVIYLILFVLFCVYVSFCFLNSQAFYGTDYKVDVIYTSDSPLLVRYNAYIVFDHAENDFRQPFFGLFSAPLMGIPCLIGSLIPAVPMALVLDYGQVLVLLFTAFLLAVELDLTPLQRICFVLMSASTYTYLLFSIMLEQYVISTFWLVLTVYLLNKDNKSAALSSFAASGTLLVSGIMVPVVLKPDERGVKLWTTWLKNLVLYGVDFVLLLIIADRFHVLWNAIDNLRFLSQFTGKTIGITDRILQYVNFAGGCFFAPESMLMTVDYTYASWQMAFVTSVNYFGVAVIVIALAGFIVTRNSFISKLALGWICLSVFVLTVVGWGLFENGLNLYSLYFGWPFMVLVFNLFRFIEDKIKKSFVVPSVTAVFCVSMLICNIRALTELIGFAIRFYPV